MTAQKLTPDEIRSLAFDASFEIASPDLLKAAINSDHPNFQVWCLIKDCVDAALAVAGVAKEGQ